MNRPPAAAIRTRGLSVDYVDAQGRRVPAADGVDLAVPTGQCLGLVGESGCGKTTVAKALMGLLPPGRSAVRGEILLADTDVLRTGWDAVRWRRISMVFQNAMSTLNPVFRVGDQIAEAMRFHVGISRREARQRTAALLESLGIPRARASAYPHELSGGMKQRAVIALALCCEPDVVIADEPTTALDVVVQEQVIGLLRDIRRRRDLTMIVVSHDLGVIRKLCDSVAVMYAGRIVEYGPLTDVVRAPRHPYTRALLAAYPSVEGPRRRVEPPPGEPPSLTALPTGCRFHPRCPRARDLCRTTDPGVGPDGDEASADAAARGPEGVRRVRCHFPHDD